MSYAVNQETFPVSEKWVGVFMNIYDIVQFTAAMPLVIGKIGEIAATYGDRLDCKQYR